MKEQDALILAIRAYGAAMGCLQSRIDRYENEGVGAPHNEDFDLVATAAQAVGDSYPEGSRDRRAWYAVGAQALEMKREWI